MWQIGITAEQISDSIILLYLAGLSAIDIRWRNVQKILLFIGMFFVMCYCIWFDRKPVVLCVAGLAAGLCFLGISRVTKEAVGYADSWLIGVLGIYLGIWRLIEVLIFAWGMLAVTALYGLTAGKWSRKTRLPAIPFLLAGYFILLIGERM